MASEYDKLIQQIEKLRRDLNELAKNKDLFDPEVVAASQILDAVLNEYDRLLKKKNK